MTHPSTPPSTGFPFHSIPFRLLPLNRTPIGSAASPSIHPSHPANGNSTNRPDLPRSFPSLFAADPSKPPRKKHHHSLPSRFKSSSGTRTTQPTVQHKQTRELVERDAAQSSIARYPSNPYQLRTAGQRSTAHRIHDKPINQSINPFTPPRRRAIN